MGIVRDITVDQLTQAVNNIDTSTLAQDSTLHDVVTAISNISGGSDPVTNTTVNTLCKDTTGQDIKDSLDDIKSAVQGLGTALGADRALIDGSNIGSPSTFRSNIGANGISITEVDVSGTTNAVGYIATAYDFNEYFLGGRFKVTGGGGCYAFFRPSAQNKVVILVTEDTLTRQVNTAIEGKLYYLNVT